jgi:sulfatase maturation enzyme AslB (radical SAM superfamily)
VARQEYSFLEGDLMRKVFIPTREEILSLLNGAKRIPFSPNYINVNMPYEITEHQGEFSSKDSYVIRNDVSIAPLDDILVLQKRIPLKVAFLKSDNQDNLLAGLDSSDSEGFQKLYEQGFIKKAGELEGDTVKSIRDSFPMVPFFYAMYLFPTDVCNLECLYCNVVNNMAMDYQKSFMNMDTAMSAVNLFVENLIQRRDLVGRTKPTYISFYGGEALVNRSLLNQTIGYAADMLEKKGLSDLVNLCVMTNCTLMDAEEAKFQCQYHHLF